MKVIALTGRAGSGKDTAALGIQILTGHLDPTWMAPSSTSRPLNGFQELDWNKVFEAEWHNGPGDVDKWPALKLAYPVYQMAAILIGYKGKPTQLMNESFKRAEFVIGLGGEKMTGRQILQKLGTEAGRGVFGDTVWLYRMDKELRELYKQGCEGVVITDCRFPNEAEFLKQYWEATILGVFRDKCNESQDHPSESEVANVIPLLDIGNNGSYRDLMNKIQAVCHMLDISNHKYTW